MKPDSIALMAMLWAINIISKRV